MGKTNVEMLEGCGGRKLDLGCFVELPEVPSPSETRANAEGRDG